MTIAERIIQLANDSAGLCACAPWRAEFARRLGPPPRLGWDLGHPYIRARKRGVSTCMVFGCRWLWMAAGVAHEVNVPAGKRNPRALRVDDPYVSASVLGLAIQFARRVGALVEDDDLTWAWPELGDGVIVTHSPGAVAPGWDHWSTVVEVSGPPEATIVTTVDAGQTCPHGRENGHQGAVVDGAHLQAILRKPPRPYSFHHGVPWLGADRVMAIVRAGRLPETIP